MIDTRATAPRQAAGMAPILIAPRLWRAAAEAWRLKRQTSQGFQAWPEAGAAGRGGLHPTERRQGMKRVASRHQGEHT